MKKNGLIIAGIIILIIVVVVAFLLPQDNEEESEVVENLLNIDYSIEGNEGSLAYDTTNPVVALYVEKYGSIVMELYPDIAPNTVNNFISLVLNGFYDNNTFHRLMPGFVLQGGDPTGTGTGDPGYYIKGEFTINGFDNNLSHEKWIVSMARGTANDTAGSQFFICIDDAKFLDGSYAAFGKVIDGFDNIEAIVENEKIKNTETGQLMNNLVLKKAIVDLKGNSYEEPEKIEE